MVQPLNWTFDTYERPLIELKHLNLSMSPLIVHPLHHHSYFYLPNVLQAEIVDMARECAGVCLYKLLGQN